jgi:hypothetical protein
MVPDTEKHAPLEEPLRSPATGLHNVVEVNHDVRCVQAEGGAHVALLDRIDPGQSYSHRQVGN